MDVVKMNHNLANQTVEDYLRQLLGGSTVNVGDKLPSVRQIGTELRVSPKTVSRAMDAYMDAGYLEKEQGRGTFLRKRLRAAATGKIGVLFCHSRSSVFESSFYSAIFAGIESAVSAQGHKVLFSSLVDAAGAVSGIPASMNTEVDGIILVDPREYVLKAVDADLKKLTVPVVAVNCAAPGREFDIVSVDNTLGVVKMIRYLAFAGHRRIGCLYAQHRDEERPAPIFRIRMNAYRQAMDEEGLTVMDGWTSFLSSGLGADAADTFDKHTLKKILNGRNAPTALFCTSDDIALRLYRLLPSLGYRIPDDISVVGFDDLRESAIIVPGLTTVKTPLFRMGTTAVERITARIAAGSAGNKDIYRILLPVDIVERESHRKL